MLRSARNESIDEMRSRKSVRDVPLHHDMMQGRVFRGRTMSGLDFELRVVDNTTNGQAISLLDQRIQEAKKAKLEGKPMGQYLSARPTAVVSKGTVYLTTDVAGVPYKIAIEMEGANAYKVDGKYQANLQRAVETIMAQAEMKLTASMAAANDMSAPYARAMR